MTRDVALKIIAATTLLVGFAFLAVVAAKQQWKIDKPCEVYNVTAIEKRPSLVTKPSENVSLKDENYFVIIFAYDAKGVIRKPAKSHVFALFYETIDGKLHKDFGISWRQASEQFKPGICRGKNFTVKETLEYAAKNDLEVQMWGPYAIDEKFYKNAVLRHNALEAGKYLYRTWDAPNRTDPSYPAVNNIHAVSDIAGCIDTEGRYGRDAAQKIVEKFESYSIVSQKNNGRDTFHDEIIQKLGITVKPTSTRRR
jgi:hypothetical protein